MSDIDILRQVLDRGLEREWEHDSITASSIHAMYLMGCLEVEQKFSQVTARADGELIARTQWDENGVTFLDYICSHPKMSFFLRATLETVHNLKLELPLTVQ